MAQIPALIGKTFKVGEVSSVGDGINKWLVLHPSSASGSAVAKGTVMIKVEGGRQLPALIGKTVTVGKSPVLGSGGMKFLALHPTAAATAAKGSAGLAASGMAGKGTVVMNVNQAHGQIQALTGKAFVVGKSPAMGHGASNMLVLHPLKTTSMAAKGVAGSGLSSASFTGGGAAAGKSALGTTMVAGKTAGNAAVMGTTAVAKGAAASGTIWSGTGLSLGLGLGLGPLGPALLVAALTAGGYYLYGLKKKRARLDEVDAGELGELAG